MQYFHVTSVKNRDSIQSHGLDWTRMGAASGIAGNASPEASGCFLCEDLTDVDWFARVINNTGGAVDVWVIEGLRADELALDASGYRYLPRTIAREQLSLTQTVDVAQ